MTRKRFVKLLMSQGYSRNEAVANAAYVQKRKVSYQKAFRPFAIRHSFVVRTDVIADHICGMQRSILYLKRCLEKNLQPLLGGDLTRILLGLQNGSKITHPQS